MWASVVMPVRNAVTTIDFQMEALSTQSCPRPWELVVADNGSSDGTRQRLEEWRARIPNLRVVDAAEVVSSYHARNIGVAHASAQRLLFCDADDVVGPSWVDELGQALDDHDFVGGALDLGVLNRRQVVVDGPDSAVVSHPFLPYALGCNLGVRRAVFDAVGGFHGEYRSGGDVDFSWRVQLDGHSLCRIDGALVHRRARESVVALFAQRYRRALWWPVLYRRFRDCGLTRGSLIILGADIVRTLLTSPCVLVGRTRARWIADAGWRVGLLAGAARHRTWFT